MSILVFILLWWRLQILFTLVISEFQAIKLLAKLTGAWLTFDVCFVWISSRSSSTNETVFSLCLSLSWAIGETAKFDSVFRKTLTKRSALFIQYSYPYSLFPFGVKKADLNFGFWPSIVRDNVLLLKVRGPSVLVSWRPKGEIVDGTLRFFSLGLLLTLWSCFIEIIMSDDKSDFLFRSNFSFGVVSPDKFCSRSISVQLLALISL